MADYSTKAVQDLKKGNSILNGQLQPVKVLGVFKNFLGSRQMYQFAPNGPIFTGEHQFVSNLEEGEVGVRDRYALITENPYLEEESDNIKHLSDLYSLLQYKEDMYGYGQIIKADFNLTNYQLMDGSTPVYFLITDGDDGSYIVDNFVSRFVLPSMIEEYEEWKYTYATLGYILKSCEIESNLDSIEEVNELVSKIKDMVFKWKSAIETFDSLQALYGLDLSKFLSMRDEGQEEILSNNKKMTFNRFLNKLGAKLLYQVLDDESKDKGKRIRLIKTIIDITNQSFECNFVNFENVF